MNINDKQRLSLIFNFVETFSNQIYNFNFDVNHVNDENHIAGIIQLKNSANFEKMKQYLIDNKCNSIFDYYEIDKQNLFIEME